MYVGIVLEPGHLFLGIVASVLLDFVLCKVKRPIAVEILVNLLVPNRIHGI